MGDKQEELFWSKMKTLFLSLVALTGLFASSHGECEGKTNTVVLSYKLHQLENKEINSLVNGLNSDCEESVVRFNIFDSWEALPLPFLKERAAIGSHGNQAWT